MFQVEIPLNSLFLPRAYSLLKNDDISSRYSDTSIKCRCCFVHLSTCRPLSPYKVSLKAPLLDRLHRHCHQLNVEDLENRKNIKNQLCN
jgi:hypothetical protein